MNEIREIKIDLNRPSINYKIHIGKNILNHIIDFLPKKNFSKIMLLTHSYLYELYGKSIEALFKENNYEFNLKLIEEGENSKDWNICHNVLEDMIQNNLDRSSLLLTLGGGVIGDLGGFCASIYQRGIDFLQIPTTLLACVDSSVGGKTAINLTNNGKNLIGSFYQPCSVVIDINLLKTLNQNEWKNGLAEVIKYAFIREDNAEFYKFLEQNKNEILERNNDEIILKMIETSVQSKAKVVMQDEYEKTGQRMLLNLGHTFAHVLESGSSYQIAHGTAVSIGMNLAVKLSRILNLITEETANKIIKLILDFGLEMQIPKQYNFNAEALVKAFVYDKKAENKKIKFVLPSGELSHSAVFSDISEKLLKDLFSISL